MSTYSQRQNENFKEKNGNLVYYHIINDLFSIFGIAHVDHNVLWCQRGIRQSRPTVEAVCVPACWDTSSSSALFVFGLKLQQDLRPRPGMSLLSWVPWDVLPPCSSLQPPRNPESGGGTGSGRFTSVTFLLTLTEPRWPHPDTQPVRSPSTQSEGQRAGEDTPRRPDQSPAAPSCLLWKSEPF